MRLAAAEAPGGARQPGERPGDAEGDEPGAGERQGEQPQSPAEPLQAERRREALQRQHRPELVAVDEEADPEAFLAVAGIGEARVFAQRGAHALRDAGKQGIAGQRRQPLAQGRRVDAQALALVEVDQQQTVRSEEHTSELQSLAYLVCRLLLEKKKNKQLL